MNRSAPMRRTPLARGTSKLGARKGPPRRTRHALPLPDGTPRVTLGEAEGEAFAFGPQSDLCKVTECAACFAVKHWRGGWPRNLPLPWTELGRASEPSIPHHEPHRSTTVASHDRDTYPLCRAHHTDGNGDTVRHLLRTDGPDVRRFYAILPFDWRTAIAEMRRRVALLTHPVVDTTASETP
jgi:hypothetical protein